MINGKKVLSVITARQGSKRLPGKNLKLFAGKPLIFWTINSSIKSKYIDLTLISTDSVEIGELAKSLGCLFPYLRPDWLSDDKARSSDVLVHALEWLEENEDAKFDYIVLLQPTSPLRTAAHIDNALEEIDLDTNADNLIAVTKFDKNLEWLKTVNSEGFLHSVFDQYDLSNNINLSSNNKFIPNGSIFISRTIPFLLSKDLYAGNCIPFLMEKEDSVDIDTIEDFDLAEYYFKRT